MIISLAILEVMKLRVEHLLVELSYYPLLLLKADFQVSHCCLHTLNQLSFSLPHSIMLCQGL